jgi:hypothetical protein
MGSAGDCELWCHWESWDILTTCRVFQWASGFFAARLVQFFIHIVAGKQPEFIVERVGGALGSAKFTLHAGAAAFSGLEGLTNYYIASFRMRIQPIGKRCKALRSAEDRETLDSSILRRINYRPSRSVIEKYFLFWKW